MLDRGHPDLVTTSRALLTGGVSRGQLGTELRNRRWRRSGTAVVQHNGPLSPEQRRRVAQLHAGPQALFTAFTGAEMLGLHGWSRPETHLLAPAGTRLRQGCPVPVRLHLHGATRPRLAHDRSVEALPDALLRAGATFRNPRPACGILAAAVQQRLLKADDLDEALDRFTRVRHRHDLRLAVADIAGGAEALSEIDFARLCRRHGLPEPMRQVVRREKDGRRRYLDATWRRRDGRLIVVEIDGALHLVPRRWWDDQIRQNELALADAVVLRYPTVFLRVEERVVVDQLKRALWL
jgi:hypothetical protein